MRKCEVIFARALRPILPVAGVFVFQKKTVASPLRPRCCGGHDSFKSTSKTVSINCPYDWTIRVVVYFAFSFQLCAFVSLRETFSFTVYPGQVDEITCAPDDSCLSNTGLYCNLGSSFNAADVSGRCTPHEKRRQE